MPSRPAKICTAPLCGAVVAGGMTRCPRHEAAPRPVDTQRPNAHRRGYTARWQRTRAAFLSEHPYCHDCDGFANEVHHIKAKRRGGTDDWTNLMSLCKPCHQSRTARGE